MQTNSKYCVFCEGTNSFIAWRGLSVFVPWRGKTLDKPLNAIKHLYLNKHAILGLLLDANWYNKQFVHIYNGQTVCMWKALKPYITLPCKRKNQAHTILLWPAKRALNQSEEALSPHLIINVFITQNIFEKPSKPNQTTHFWMSSRWNVITDSPGRRIPQKMEFSHLGINVDTRDSEHSFPLTTI